MKAAIHSLGCKVNTFEAKQMTDLLSENGFEIVAFNETADIYIINTCSVTNIADHKSRQMLHRARALNPDAIIVAAGCYSDTHDKESILNDNIDIVVVNEEKKDIVNIIRKYCTDNNLSMPDTTVSAENGGLSLSSEHSRTRMFFKAQDGCNMFCSYCIIPYARGRIKSPSIRELLELARNYVQNGYREFVVTGIHLSSYGLDRPDSGENLISLLEAMSGIEGIERIRLGSLEPMVITREFTDRLVNIPQLCPHFHLSLQSGSDSVLKRMNRHYTTSEYFKSVALLREAFDKPAMTTDIIVGFPGETDTEFEETKEFLNRVNFYETHVFKYSRRKGTVADRMPDQITNAVKTSRERVLLKMTAARKRAFADSFISDRPVEVLFEENSRGYTREYVRVESTSKIEEGSILTGHITGRINDDIMKFKPDTGGRS